MGNPTATRGAARAVRHPRRARARRLRRRAARLPRAHPARLPPLEDVRRRRLADARQLPRGVQGGRARGDGAELAGSRGHDGPRRRLGTALAYLVVRTDLPGRRSSWRSQWLSSSFPASSTRSSWIFLASPRTGVLNAPSSRSPAPARSTSSASAGWCSSRGSISCRSSSCSWRPRSRRSTPPSRSPRSRAARACRPSCAG